MHIEMLHTNEVVNYVTELFKPHQVYLVGGGVRDAVMGIEPKDYDFCIRLHPDEITAIVRKAGRRAYMTGARFGTIGFKTPDGKYYIEVTATRGEEYAEDSRHPVVVYGVDLSEDLSRRDFTFNALAYRHGKLIDQFGGVEDIELKVIRAVGNPTLRFKEDPLRMLRAARFASRFSFNLEAATAKSLAKYAHRILTVSKERWVMEMDYILSSENPAWGLDIMMWSGLMRYVIPELSIQFKYPQNSRYHDHDLWTHTMLVVSSAPADINLRWAALLHDVAKPFVRIDKEDRSIYPKHDLLGAEMVDHIARRLKFSNDRREAIVHIVLNHLRDDSPLREADNKHKRRID